VWVSFEWCRRRTGGGYRGPDAGLGGLDGSILAMD
jgi:hypothetical protein